MIEETKGVQKAVKDSRTDLSQLLEQALVKQIKFEVPLPETPKVEPHPEIPAIKYPDNKVIGPIAQKYLSTRADDYDKTFGLKYSDDSKTHFIGKYQVDIDHDDVIVNGKRYIGTPGLWELLMVKNPETQNNKYANLTKTDANNYLEIIFNSGAYHNQEGKPLSSSGEKWIHFIGREYRRRKEEFQRSQNTSQDTSTTGSGTTFLPTDSDFLVNRLYDLLANKQAGHTLDYNEVGVITDQIFKQGLISDYVLANIMTFIRT